MFLLLLMLNWATNLAGSSARRLPSEPIRLGFRGLTLETKVAVSFFRCSRHGTVSCC